jgi:uncharacterized protein YjbI with pentapeptide repeats
VLTNLDGGVLMPEAIRDGLDLGDRDLRRANFSRVVAAALELSGSDLRGSDFSDSDLYWADFFSSDCSKASFRNAVLQGANFKSACLRHADFSGATIGPDQLGKPSSFAHADLTGAILDGASMSGTHYDPKTMWPEGFNPREHGLILTEKYEDWLVEPVCRESSSR